jgi:predicted ATP-dependent serine protease
MSSEIVLGDEVGLADYDSRISKAQDVSLLTKKLTGLPTGTLLDDMFVDHENKSIGGVPKTGQMAITGSAGAGKSILISEIALKASARGIPTLLVTSEDVFHTDSERFDLQARLKVKADILEIDWTVVQDNLYVLDAVTNSDLRQWKDFAETYRYACMKHSIQLSLIDSVTMLDDKRNALKYRIMELCRYNQENGITMLAVNQRTKETWDAYEMAGGHAIAHAVDGTILVDYGRTYHPDQVAELGKRGTKVNMVKIQDCRLCGFHRERVLVEITNDGFLRKKE